MTSWDDQLTWALITAITDNPIIKQGLFPSPGANVSTTKGGGLRKTDHHWALCREIFSHHQKYEEAFNAVSEAKEKAIWCGKVKNCLAA